MSWLDDPSADDLARMTENIQFTGEAFDANEILPPAGSPVKVVRSVRLPFELSSRVDAVAAERGITPSELIRALIETGLTEPSDSDLVSPLEALAAITLALEQLPRRSNAA